MEKLAELNSTSPAELFVKLWKMAADWDEALRSRETSVSKSFEQSASESLQLVTEQAASSRLLGLLAGYDGNDAIEWMSACLWMMRSIDEAFYAIHPRHVVFPGASPSIPNWLLDLQNFRQKSGVYIDCLGYRLIARGPLQRREREERAGSADSLADRFAALTVVGPTCRKGKLPVSIQVFGGNSLNGVVSPIKRGEEAILFAAVAEDLGDIKPVVRTVGERGYVDYQVVTPSLCADRMLTALVSAGSDVDIAIAPELVSTEPAVAQLQESLRSRRENRPRIIVAGSGLTEEIDPNVKVAWNETVVLNRRGKLLWKQRKIVPSELTIENAKRYGMDTNPDVHVYHEDTASGSKFFVVDLDSFGRCVVLICQDIETRDISEEVIADYQPDWVFTPILDPGIKHGQWVHQRAFDLSKLSQARFLISSSTWLAKCAGIAAAPFFGLAVGPCSPTPIENDLKSGSAIQEKSRAYALVKQPMGTNPPAFAMLRWRTNDPIWEKTHVGAELKPI